MSVERRQELFEAHPVAGTFILALVGIAPGPFVLALVTRNLATIALATGAALIAGWISGLSYMRKLKAARVSNASSGADNP